MGMLYCVVCCGVLWCALLRCIVLGCTVTMGVGRRRLQPWSLSRWWCGLSLVLQVQRHVVLCPATGWEGTHTRGCAVLLYAPPARTNRVEPGWRRSESDRSRSLGVCPWRDCVVTDVLAVCEYYVGITNAAKVCMCLDGWGGRSTIF